MASPDLTPFLDLRVYDRDAQEVIEVALQDLQLKLPGWVPREDNTEVLLIEAMALEVAETIFAINRLPGSIMTILMGLYGNPRDEGALPTATVTITGVNTFGYSLPANTRFMLAIPGGYEPVIFTNPVPVQVPNGTLSVTFPVVGNRRTDQANGIQPGTTLELLDAVSFVETVVLASEVSGGRSPESDQDWATRGVALLRRLTNTLVVPQHFTTAAVERDEVVRAYTVDNYNGTLGTGTPGDHAGHVTLAVYGPGEVLTPAQRAQIAADFKPMMQANLVLHVVDPNVTTVNISLTVKKFPNYTNAEVQDAITAALGRYLSPSSWPWDGTVRRNEIIALVSNLPEVDYVQTLASPATDIALSGVAPLADLGTTTVTVI